jgi:hypothetical protein
MLEKLLARSGAAAPIVRRLQPHLLGRIGFNEFKLGHLDAARERLAAARDGCVAAEDDEGAAIYSENLGVIGREMHPGGDGATEKRSHGGTEITED